MWSHPVPFLVSTQHPNIAVIHVHGSFVLCLEGFFERVGREVFGPGKGGEGDGLLRNSKR